MPWLVQQQVGKAVHQLAELRHVPLQRSPLVPQPLPLPCQHNLLNAGCDAGSERLLRLPSPPRPRSRRSLGPSSPASPGGAHQGRHASGELGDPALLCMLGSARNGGCWPSMRGVHGGHRLLLRLLLLPPRACALLLRRQRRVGRAEPPHSVLAAGPLHTPVPNHRRCRVARKHWWSEAVRGRWQRKGQDEVCTGGGSCVLLGRDGETGHSRSPYTQIAPFCHAQQPFNWG